MSDPDWSGTAPPAPLSWGQIQQVDKRVSNAGRGAVVGGAALGAVTALFAIAIEYAAHEPESFFNTEEPNYTRAGLIGGGIGAIVGAGLGAAIGSTSNHWVPVYLRR
jgi:multisubunit Na+/H+ antiporter MnhB subunit